MTDTRDKIYCIDFSNKENNCYTSKQCYCYCYKNYDREIKKVLFLLKRQMFVIRIEL